MAGGGLFGGADHAAPLGQALGDRRAVGPSDSPPGPAGPTISLLLLNAGDRGAVREAGDDSAR